MKKIILWCSIILISLVVFESPTSTQAQTNTKSVSNESTVKLAATKKKQYAYLKTYWGDSKKQVKKVLKKKVIVEEGKNSIIFETTTFGYLSYTNFEFKNNKLMSVFVSFDLVGEYLDSDEMEAIHDLIYGELKPTLNTESRGKFSLIDDGFFTTWKLKSRIVTIGVYDDEDEVTQACILYLKP